MDSPQIAPDGLTPGNQPVVPLGLGVNDVRDSELVHRDLRLPRALDKQLAAMASREQVSTGELIVKILRDAAF